MRRRYGPLLAIALAAAFALTMLTACGSSSSTGKSGVSTTMKPKGPPVVMLRKTKLGRVLVDTRGHTLYVYDADPDGATTCIDGLCAAGWRAYVVKSSNVVVGPGLKPSMFTTIPGLHGVKIVAVKRRALYAWVTETRAGTTEGQSEDWHAVGADGNAIG